METKSQKWAFGFAMAFGAVALMAVFASPVAGTLYAAIFFAVAWGIRRGQPWAAIAGVYFALSPIVAAAFELGNANGLEVASFATTAVVMLAASFWFIRAAAQLGKLHTATRPSPAWLAVLCIAVISRICLYPYMQSSVSMEPTLMQGDLLLTESVSMHFRSPQRGDLTVFRYPVDRKETFVKRIVGVPGDRLRIQDKVLYRNGSPVEEPYVLHATPYVDSYRDNFPSAPISRIYPAAYEMLRGSVQNGEVRVPEGKYFVLGDSRDDSLDSRYWGFVSKDDLIGKPLLIYQSINQQGGRRAIRWNRFFKPL